MRMSFMCGKVQLNFYRSVQELLIDVLCQCQNLPGTKNCPSGFCAAYCTIVPPPPPVCIVCKPSAPCTLAIWSADVGSTIECQIGKRTKLVKRCSICSNGRAKSNKKKENQTKSVLFTFIITSNVRPGDVFQNSMIGWSSCQQIPSPFQWIIIAGTVIITVRIGGMHLMMYSIWFRFDLQTKVSRSIKFSCLSQLHSNTKLEEKKYGKKDFNEQLW